MHMHAHDHDHDDHDHDHDHGPDIDQPLDTANQSLSEALQVSFRVLKGIMLVLVVVYLFSNVRSVGSSEQALIVRLGALRQGVHEAGLVWAFPFPIDEIIVLPTRKSNDLVIDSHNFHRREDEIGKPISFVTRGHGGLNPSLDGALITSDSSLVHVEWKVTYRIDDVNTFVREFAGDRVAAAEQLIRTVIETTGIALAAELNAEEFIRTKFDYVQTEMRRRVNERLTELHSGVSVVLVEMLDPTPPLTVREAFENTQKAESAKQARVRAAEQEATRLLNEAGGSAYAELLKALDAQAAAATDDQKATAKAALDDVLATRVEGKAGRLLRDAGAYHSVVVNRVQSDVELYRTLLPEYERNPSLLIGRLWEQTYQRIMNARGVTKFFRPGSEGEYRLTIPLDPEQTRMDEELRLQKEEFDPKKLTPKHWVPLGPESE